MSDLSKQYSVLEIKQIMERSEGAGPGVGGHAISAHGHQRTDVTSRGKSKDSAFKRGWSISIPSSSAAEDRVMRGVFGDDYTPSPPTVKHMQSSWDQYVAVCNALNSPKGQAKLLALDQLPDRGTQPAPPKSPLAFQADASGVRSLVPSVRRGSHTTESTIPLNKIHFELLKIDGKLHIHTAYAV